MPRQLTDLNPQIDTVDLGDSSFTNFQGDIFLLILRTVLHTPLEAHSDQAFKMMGLFATTLRLLKLTLLTIFAKSSIANV